MYIVEKRDYRYEDQWWWEDKRYLITHSDNAVVGYETVAQAVEACNRIIETYSAKEDWDVINFPPDPILGEWYSVAEYYHDTIYLRIFEVRT